MNWDTIAVEHLAVVDQVFNDLRPGIERLADELTGRLRAGGKVLVCGNGGSAADAQHIAGELVNRFLRERKPYACIALTTDTSVLTAIGNDYSYDQVFEKQVQALGRAGDVLIAISTSGRAANVLRAVAAARAQGVVTVALTGGTGGELAKAADHVLCVSCTRHTPRIQEGHLLIFHALCELLEERMETA
jgi:D-sedoheptulose 7-phosphate isomerase